MRKFVIGVGGRSGSTLYASLLDSVYMLQFFANYEKRVFHSGDFETPDWSFPIQHTHQQSVFFSAPPEFERIWARRNFLDMIVSQLVAKQTNVYHIFSEQAHVDYAEQFATTKIQLDVDEIKNMLYKKSKEAQDILDNVAHFKQQQIPYHELHYSVHTALPEIFFRALDINVDLDATLPVWPQPMSVDKWKLVENIQEIILQYEKFECKNDIDREVTLTKLISYIERT